MIAITKLSDGDQPSAGAALSAIRFESFVESDGALRQMSIESQSQEDLRWHTLVHKPWRTLEAEFLVVLRMSHETAATSLHALQP